MGEANMKMKSNKNSVENAQNLSIAWKCMLFEWTVIHPSRKSKRANETMSRSKNFPMYCIEYIRASSDGEKSTIFHLKSTADYWNISMRKCKLSSALNNNPQSIRNREEMNKNKK